MSAIVPSSRPAHCSRVAIPQLCCLFRDHLRFPGDAGLCLPSLALLAARSLTPCSMDFATTSSVRILRVCWLRSCDCTTGVGNLISTRLLNSTPSATLSILSSYRFGPSSHLGSPFSLRTLRIALSSRMVPALGICFGPTRPVHQRPQDHEYHPQHERVRIEAVDLHQ